ncbi:MAG: fumarylacetoacetate hydrolase family protein [Rhodospirillales bacterium]|jgi:2-keto-4-pentenoate hydratase/2-oxohepta-3-ene-1,7-dioic acid hydratase in catechol pathway
MKFVRFNNFSETSTFARPGVVLDGNLTGDLRAAYARLRVEEQNDPKGRQTAAYVIPGHLREILAAGEPSLTAVDQAHKYLKKILKKEGRKAKGLDGEVLFTPWKETRLHAPIRGNKVIAVGRNYAEHIAEGGLKMSMKVPSAWIKANSTVIGPQRAITKPKATKKLDYECELAIVIGEDCKNVPEKNAYDVIFGYTVGNDISARDIVQMERAEGNQLLGKMFDTFCPIGPWVITKDEIKNPMNLKVISKVNGKLRQNGNTKNMIWNVPQLIAFLSQMTLHAGDVILTGTPSGVAKGKEPDQSWYLKPGDKLTSEVEKVGSMTQEIVADKTKKTSWTWPK